MSENPDDLLDDDEEGGLEEDIDIELEDGMLTVRAELKQEEMKEEETKPVPKKKVATKKKSK